MVFFGGFSRVFYVVLRVLRCGCLWVQFVWLAAWKKIRNGIFFTFKVWLILKRLLSLYCIQKHISMYLTDREKELVEALRNYRRAYPNGARNLEIYILELVYELMETD